MKRTLPPGLRALRHRNFRLYFAGQGISMLGSWIQQVALSWLIYRITGSAALLGVTAFCSLFPQLLVGPLAGAWIDKQDKRRWLIIVQSLLALQAFILAAGTWSDAIGSAFIVFMAICLGVINSFDGPLRQSLIASFVDDREDLPNALALNAMLFNAGRFLGPPLAGVMLGLMSESACFLFNGLSFLAVIIGLARMRVTAPPRASGSVGEVFRNGLAYAWQTMSVRKLILVLVALNLTASAYTVLLPVFARDIFAGDATTLGWLWGAAGCGAFSSTIFLATRKSNPQILGGVCSGVLMGALALLGMGASQSFGLAMVCMLVLGFGISVCNVGTLMLLQGSTAGEFRGRVVAFFTATRFGFDAMGGLLAGLLAVVLGPRVTMLAEGAVLLACATVLLSGRRRLEEQIAQAAAASHVRSGTEIQRT